MARTGPCYVEGRRACKPIRLRAFSADHGANLTDFRCISLFFSLLPGSDNPRDGFPWTASATIRAAINPPSLAMIRSPEQAALGSKSEWDSRTSQVLIQPVWLSVGQAGDDKALVTKLSDACGKPRPTPAECAASQTCSPRAGGHPRRVRALRASIETWPVGGAHFGKGSGQSEK